MSRTAVCRLCLATDVNMHNISNSQVQEVFEKLTSKKLPEKGRPDTMCYLCYSQLWKCSRILDLYRKTEDVFDQLSSNGIEITYDTISFLKRRNIVDLLITPVTQIEITTAIIQEHKKTDKNQNVTIKEEPMDEPVEVKLEPTELDVECEVVLQGTDVIYEESNDSTKDSTWDVTTQKQCLKKERRRKRDNEKRKKVKENIQVKNYPIANPKKSYSCKICDKQFDRKRYLRRHTTQHDTKKYVCGECNESFTFKNNMLRHHEIAHTEKKKYSCDICDKMFHRSDHLQHHRRSHSKEKPFPCKICNMTFTSSSNVQQHINSIHLNMRPFACDLCNKTFSRKGNLQEHYRAHTGEKPFNCSKCSQTFAYLANLKSHLSKMHSDS